MRKVAPWTTRLSRQAAAFVAIGILSLLIPSAEARADSPTTFGWWTSENPGLSIQPVPTVVPGGGGPDGLPSDIPDGGFEVANLSGDSSYAAFDYSTDGATVQSIVLTLAPHAASLPNSQVEACPLTGSGRFSPATGAPLADGPAYSCTSTVPGVEDASAGTVSFAVDNLVQDGVLAIAIVAVGTSREVFDAPGQSTVLVSSPSSSAPVGGTAAGSDSGQFPESFPSLVAGSALGLYAMGQAVAQSHTPSTSPHTTPQTPVVRSTQSMVAVTTSANTIRAGSATVGALLVLLAAIVIVSRNRQTAINSDLDVKLASDHGT